MKYHSIIGILGSMLLLAGGPAHAEEAPRVERHPASPPGLILKGVTVKAGATMLFLSGQLADPLPASAGKAPAERAIADYGDTRTQTMSALAKIKALLAERGFAMSDVVKLTVFLAGDPGLAGRMDFTGMNEGFRQYFGSADNPATVARSTVQVAALVHPAYLVEIEATAAK